MGPYHAGVDQKRIGLPFAKLEIAFWGIYCDMDAEKLQAQPEFYYKP